MDLTVYCNDVNIRAYSSGRTEVNLNNIEYEMNIIKQLIEGNADNFQDQILDLIGWDYIKEYYDVNSIIDEAIEERREK
jgi:hypothetical protein